ncbi:MAG TPA: MarR family transcriptional regulator [Anaerolineae bacterium]
MRKAELTALVFEIWSFTGISTKLMAQDLERRLAEYCPGMSTLQYGVMRMLEHRPFTLRELSDKMSLAPSTLVPVVDRLESEGLLVRGKDPEDRRRAPLELTDHAQQILIGIPDVYVQDHLVDALHTMGAEKSHELSQLLQELVRQLDQDKGLVEHVLSNSTHVANRIDRCSAKGALPRSPNSPKAS